MYEVGDLIVYGRTGICEVTEITTLKMDGVPKDKLYYILRPVREKRGKVFTPVDNEKIVMRKVISKEEAEELIREIPQIEGLWIGSEKQREEKYKECMKSCKCAEWVRIIKTLQAVRTKADEKVNSYEIFVNRKKTHIRNSKGVDVSFSSGDDETELVINVKKDGHEIELLREITFSGENVDRITEEAGKLFVSGHDRLDAKPTTQQEHGAVLLTGDDVVTFFRYFTAHTNASNQYMGVAKARIGEKMTGEEADPLTIRLIPAMEGSTRKEPYDSDGNPVTECLLFEDGICRNFWGSTQHAYYMKMENTTSMNNAIVSGGTMTEAELRKIPHLEITEFSCFDMDPVSGTFGGEIRLGYESDGKTRQAVTSGSLSGNYGKVLKNMKFSKETRQINNFIVPCAVLLEDVSIAGC